MSHIRQSNLLVADAVQFGRSAVATIGIQSYTRGCLSHAIQVRVYIMAATLEKWLDK